ncbi:MAG: PqqD family protein [Chloroflexota bacterium]
MAGDSSSEAAATGFALRPDVVATILDHGALLLDLESKYFYLLNPSGWAVTQLFEDGASVDHTLERAQAWGATEADLGAVRGMVAQMHSERLIEPALVVANSTGTAPTEWQPVSLERQAEPLQKVIVSAFDPSIPLAE